ncbi:hypothetical protein [Amycolatopsis speibonae]|uniref:Uncharacterized protein n=1 Tax=Amycolatopsis speibonae TaxID=1450224 RepID=A0ABV7NVS7_9PSEU
MDGLHAAVPGCAAMLPVLPEGEVWVAMPYKPAFPGIIPADETPPGVIEDQTCFPVLEAFYGTAQYRFTWHGDTLEIHDDPWGDVESQPRVIQPGDDGRYEIRDLWYPVAPSAVGELCQRHPDALAALTHDDTPAPAPNMLAYLTAQPGASSRMRQNVETALAKLATELGR